MDKTNNKKPKDNKGKDDYTVIGKVEVNTKLNEDSYVVIDLPDENIQLKFGPVQAVIFGHLLIESAYKLNNFYKASTFEAAKLSQHKLDLSTKD